MSDRADENRLLSVSRAGRLAPVGAGTRLLAALDPVVASGQRMSRAADDPRLSRAIHAGAACWLTQASTLQDAATGLGLVVATSLAPDAVAAMLHAVRAYTSDALTAVEREPPLPCEARLPALSLADLADTMERIAALTAVGTVRNPMVSIVSEALIRSRRFAWALTAHVAMRESRAAAEFLDLVMHMLPSDLLSQAAAALRQAARDELQIVQEAIESRRADTVLAMQGEPYHGAGRFCVLDNPEERERVSKLPPLPGREPIHFDEALVSEVYGPLQRDHQARVGLGDDAMVRSFLQRLRDDARLSLPEPPRASVEARVDAMLKKVRVRLRRAPGDTG